MSIVESLKKAEGEKERRDQLKTDMILASLINKDIVFEALARLIVARNLPYEAVQWPELRSLLIICNPAIADVLINSSSTVPSLIERCFKERRHDAKTEMRDAGHQIHISLDGWKAPNGLQYLAICAHFVNCNGELKKYTIALPELCEGKGGKAQAAALIPVLQEYDIAGRLGYIVSDNATTNDVLCRTLEAWMRTQGIKNWKASQRRIRCQGHVINLIVQAFLFCKSKEVVDTAMKAVVDGSDTDLEDILVGEMATADGTQWRSWGPLGKLHNFVAWLRGSSERLTKFTAQAGRMIPLDNDTRWNSWLYMIKTARLPIVKSAINQTYEANLEELREDILSLDDWKSLDTIHRFLGPFEQATKQCERDDATLDQTLFTVDFLITHLDRTDVRSSISSMRIYLLYIESASR